MRTKQRFQAIAVVAALLAAGACGSDDDDSGDAPAESAVDEPDTDADADTETDAETDADTDTEGDSGATETTTSESAADEDGDIDTDGVLRVGKFASYFWDPHLVPSSFGIVDLAMVYDRLVHTAPDGSLIPGLAESWEYSDDGLTLTLTLRDGVQFQDGAVFDADAVKLNLDRAMTLEGSTVASELARVASVDVVDELTVAITLTEPDATIPAVLSDRAGAIISPDAIDDPELDQNPVGAGMYQLTELSPGASYTVERWDGYWDPEAVDLQAIEVSILPDSTTRVNALTTGQIDIAPIEPFDVGRVESTDGIEVRLNDTLRFVYLGLDRSVTPFDDILVREAITRAIDRDALVNGPWLGYATATQQIWPEGFVGHVDELDEAYPYDPDRARELLAEAGYDDSFVMNIVVPPQPVSYQQLGEAVQTMLADVGITAELQLTEASALGQVVYVDRVFPASILYTNGRSDPANTVGERYTSTGFFNPGGDTTPELEALHAEALAETDPDARAAILENINRELVESLLEIPLFFPQEPEGVSDRVVGYEAFVSGKPEFRNVGVRSDS